MNAKMQTTLIGIASLLEQNDIKWRVGASILLHQYGLIESPSDIDIVVRASDIDRTDEILSALGTKKKEKGSGIYSTDFFFEYCIDGMDVDVMAGLKINLQNSVYEYLFQENGASNTFVITDTPIPFMTLEEWYILYQLIPNREPKVGLIETYLKENGIGHRSVLSDHLHDNSLPYYVVSRIQSLIGE